MTTNASITIYNKVANKEKKCFEYQGRYIPEVHWHTDQKVEVTDKGIKSVDVYEIRIPKVSLEGYVPPDEFTQSPLLESLWTVNNGDLFILGACKLVNPTLGDLEKLHRPFGMIKSWSDNRRGRLQHIRIGGAV